MSRLATVHICYLPENDIKFYFSSNDIFIMILEAKSFSLPVSIYQLFLIMNILCEAKIGFSNVI